MPRLTRYVYWSFVFMLTAGLVGCSSEPTESPEEVARGFMEANVAEDEEKFYGYLTATAREAMQGDESISTQAFDSYEIGESSVEGEVASVEVSTVQDGDEQTVQLMMRPDEGPWRIYAIKLDLGDGMTMTMDLESIADTMESMMEGMAEGLGEALAQGFEDAFTTSPEELAAMHEEFEALGPVSEADYNAQWQNSIEYNGQPAIAALAEISGKIGVPIDVRDASGLSGEVASSTVGLSYAAAIETIANDGGMHAIFPDPPYEGGGMLEDMAVSLAESMTALLEESGVDLDGLGDAMLGDMNLDDQEGVIRFEAGDRPLPIVFQGPFVVEVADIQENVPYGTGEITLAFRAFGLSDVLFAMLESDTGSTEFDAIADTKDRSLIDDEIMYLGGGTAEGPIYLDSYSLDLLNLIREVEVIGTVEGTQRLLRPEQVSEFVFDGLAEGQSQEVDGMTATVSSIGTYTAIEIATPNADAREMSAYAIATDAAGEPVEVQFVSPSAWEADELEVGINLADGPSSVRLKIVSKTAHHVYDFAFSDVPLQRFAEMPEKIEELAFEGHETPISVEFVEIIEPDESFAKVLIRVTNHSNKTVSGASLNMVYLDTNGNKIDDFPSSIMGSQSWVNNEFVQEPVAEAGATSELEATAFSMPAGTVDIRCEVSQIDFIDGTDWSIY